MTSSPWTKQTLSFCPKKWATLTLLTLGLTSSSASLSWAKPKKDDADASATKNSQTKAAAPLSSSEQRSYVTLSKAISLLSGGQKAEAYSLLEDLFASAQDPQDKYDAALILSYADGKLLKKQKRFFYSAFATQHLPAGQDKSILLRITGDGAFEESDLNAARAHYESLIRSQNPVDQDYGQYKLGWVDLNEKKADQAFQRWFHWLDKRRGQMKDLELTFIRDLGRAWAETSPASGEQTKLVSGLRLSDEERNEFLDGMVAGMRRLHPTKELPVFREQLATTRYYGEVLPRILSQGIGIAEDPCFVVEWLKPVSIKTLPVDVVAPRLNTCFISIQKDVGKGKKGDFSAALAKDSRVLPLVPLYEQLPLVGYARWQRASFFRDLGAAPKACAENMMALNEESFQQKDPFSELLDNTVETCRKAAETQSLSGDTKLAFVESLERAIGAHFLTQQRQAKPDAYYGLFSFMAKNDDIRAQVLNRLRTKPALFKESLIPMLTLDSLSKDEKGLHAQFFLDNFSARPIPGEADTQLPWIELVNLRVNHLVEKEKNHQAAFVLLNQWIPFNDVEASAKAKGKVSKRIAMWYYLALSVPAPQAQDAGISALLDVARFSVQNANRGLMGKIGQANDFSVALELGNKFKLFDDLWLQWNEIRKQVEGKHPVVVATLNNLYSQCLASPSTSVCQKLTVNEDGKIIQRVIQSFSSMESGTAKGRSQLLADLKKNSLAPAEFPFVADLSFIDDMELNLKLVGKTLRFNGQLPRNIDEKVKLIQKYDSRIRKHTWSSPKAGLQARTLLAGHCEDFATAIDSIQFPKEASAEQVEQWKTQLGQIATSARSWKANLLSQSEVADVGGH